MAVQRTLLCFSSGFGFCTFNQTVKSLVKNGSDLNEAIMDAHSSKGLRLIQNISIILGWCPIVGSIIGIAHLVFSSKQIDNLKKIGRINIEQTSLCKKNIIFWSGIILRGVMETLSLGYLLILPDLFMTAIRSCKNIESPRPHFDTI